jgi:HAD superfamily hydrolase (TIGR01509 family)
MPLDVKRVRAICFDLDGTLSDSDDLLVARLALFLHPFRFLFPQREAERIARRMVMAGEAPGNFLISIPDRLGFDKPMYALSDWVASREKRSRTKFKLIPGVRELLADLSRRYPLAVVSARETRSTDLFLDHFALSGYFRCVASDQTCEHTKPYPDPILWAAARMGVRPEECLMVGDTSVDIRAGQAAGAQTVGVLCGFGERPELERRGADLILNGTADLLSVLGAG